jgi:Cu-Zn family superoxide dismutase
MKIFLPVAIVILFAAFSFGAGQVVTINLVTADGIGKEIGKISAADTEHGLLITPDLSDLPPGLHGFHLHEHPSCDPAKKDEKMTSAQAAGGHLDPQKTTKHEGPYGHGHLGDLPALYVGSDGKANLPVLAPRLKVADLNGHALMIHAGGDNYSDQPQALGGGGARIACGVVK